MTGYHITPGYISGYSNPGTAPWPDLRELAMKVCNDPKRIADEALTYYIQGLLNPQTFYTYACRYRDRTDATIRFIEPNEKGGPHITIIASGGGQWRIAREHVARAFVRLLMAEAHRTGLEISVIVA